MGPSSYLAAATFPQPPSSHLGLAKPVCENMGMGPQRKSASDSFNEIATVRIELRHTDPPIWREVEVPTSITLLVLHDIIQAVMGWFDCHLWEFAIDRRKYGLMDEDWGGTPHSRASHVRLRDVLKPGRTLIDCTYDLGDRWEHQLTVTDVRTGKPGVSYPRYVDGERNGPPEDCRFWCRTAHAKSKASGRRSLRT